MAEAPPPFDRQRHGLLLEAASIDVALVSSRANILYLTGGYYHHPFDRSADRGDGRYLPLLGVPAEGSPFMVAGPNEAPELAAKVAWVEDVRPAALGATSAAAVAARALAERGLESAVIGVEPQDLPLAAADELRRLLPRARFADVLPIMLELRSVKRAAELDRMARAARITALAIHAAIETRPGTLSEVAAAVARETEAGGGTCHFCFTSAGTDRRRFPRPRRWEWGEMLQVDSGCDLEGYHSDVCRMAVRGAPEPRACDVYAACVEIHQAIAGSLRSGLLGGDLVAVAERALAAGSGSVPGRTVIHGMGLGHHELPDVMRFPDRPLEAGNVISLEVELTHPDLGVVKVEDALVVTATGCDLLGIPFGGLRNID